MGYGPQGGRVRHNIATTPPPPPPPTPLDVKTAFKFHLALVEVRKQIEE